MDPGLRRVLRPFIVNWEEVALHFIRGVHADDCGWLGRIVIPAQSLGLL
jgi:hypothetical protein